jgi:TonB family protein
MKNQTNLRVHALLPVIAFSLLISFSCGKNSKTEPIPSATVAADEEKTIDGAYKVVDVMPEFPGGDSALLAYVARNTQYPEEAKKLGIQGKVIARFMVKEDGSVSEVKILQSASPLLDAESIRVVSSLPKFTPGTLKGKAVPVWFMIPIGFKLK